MLLTTLPLSATATSSEPTGTTPADTLVEGRSLGEVKVVANRQGRVKTSGLMNGDLIGQGELFRAACCNLGESFTTNPSVDVNYADAATGAQQIRLLGLSGTYVQMLTENIPNYRGASIPYSLGFIPGSWMQSIQVSKGCSSVKNGYESITGQINVEFKKPQATQFVEANAYVNTKQKFEANFQGNLHLNSRWSTALLAHYEILDKAHDDNGDGFVDMPKQKQYNLQNRWIYRGDHLLSQFSVKGLKENRQGGQRGHGHSDTDASAMPYLIDIDNERYEAFAKNAWLFNDDQNTNIALILSGSLHMQDAEYGHKLFGVNEKNGYASLLYEADYTERHSLSAGLSLNYDYFRQDYRLDNSHMAPVIRSRESETTPGAYLQYTYKLGTQLTLMGGVRADHSSVYGTFVTPRAHLKWSPSEVVSFRASAGKGYRTNHVLAENNNLLASGRQIVINPDLDQEEAWNYGISAQFNIPLFERTLQFNAEYYYTDFIHQTVIDLDTDPHAVVFSNLDGSSYSHTLQAELSYPLFPGFTATATYRRNIVRSTYGGQLLSKPLTSRYKGLLTASYKPGLEKWQFDVTLQLNGGGRMPRPYTLDDGTSAWNTSFHSYQQLSAQITRHYRHFSIYAGGENITNFRQRNPIVGAANPWSPDFDSTLIWGPIHGSMYYLGIRLNWNKI